MAKIKESGLPGDQWQLRSRGLTGRQCVLHGRLCQWPIESPRWWPDKSIPPRAGFEAGKPEAALTQRL